MGMGLRLAALRAINVKFNWSLAWVVWQVKQFDAPGFGVAYSGFPAILEPSNCLKTAKLRRLTDPCWSFAVFSYPVLLTNYWHGKEKLDGGYHWEVQR